MIYFISDARRTGAILGYLKSWGRPLGGRVHSLHYELLAEADELPVGTYVFAEPHRLSEAEREIALEVVAQLSAGHPSVRVLNDPALRLHPLESLHRLAEQGCAVRAYRPDSHPQSPRFPALLRDEWSLGEHDERVESEHELGAVLYEAGLRRVPEELLMVVEAPALESEARYEGGSLFRIGDAMIAGPRAVSASWPPRDLPPRDPFPGGAEDLVIAWGEQAFGVCEIEYGRLDFALADGQPLAWSLDTNPSFLPSPENLTPEHATSLQRVADRVNAALEQIDEHGAEGQWVPIELAPDLLEALDAEYDTRAAPP